MDTNDKVCSACGTPSKPGDLFCLNCGAKLDFASGTSAAPPSGGNVATPSSGASFPTGAPAAPSAGSAPAAPAAPTPQNANSAAYSAPQNQGAPSAPGYGATSPGTAGSSTPVGSPPASGGAPAQPGAAAPATPPSAAQPSAPATGYGTTQPGNYQQPNATQQPPAAGYGSAQQQGYTAPGGGSNQPPTTGQQPPQYGQQPGQYGQQGNAAYGNQPQAGYPSSGQPGQYPGYGTPPAKKKKSVVPIVIIAVVVAVIAIAVVLFFLLRGSGGKAEYNTLLENITSSTSTTQVASYQSELDTFKTEHPDLVDADLTALVTACVEYDEASDDEYRYTDMIYELERLESSTVPQVASCASGLLPGIESAYDDYLAYIEEEEAAAAAAASAAAEEAASANSIDLASSPMPMLGNGTGALSVLDGQDVFSINAQNTSDKTITYFEIVAFFYDANGNPINGTNGYTWEWKKDDSMTIAPGGDHVPERDGYWAINSHSDVAYVVPFVVYTVFDDGTTWGSQLSSTDKAALADQLQARANEIVAAAM